ncbi:MAG: hypothetical protein F6J93_31380 [Oscillatoria sp. SIO1A7]|nr:hypothetical protein [Oscillatoria sp. SIO1A7]
MNPAIAIELKLSPLPIEWENLSQKPPWRTGETPVLREDWFFRAIARISYQNSG